MHVSKIENLQAAEKSQGWLGFWWNSDKKNRSDASCLMKNFRTNERNEKLPKNSKNYRKKFDIFRIFRELFVRFVRSNSLRRCDFFGPNFIKIRAILAILRSLKDFRFSRRALSVTRINYWELPLANNNGIYFIIKIWIHGSIDLLLELLLELLLQLLLVLLLLLQLYVFIT